MSEFDQFESAEKPPATQEEDPSVAEFLAREQDQMAELEGENFDSESAPAEPEATAVDSAPSAGDGEADFFSPPAESLPPTADDILGEFDTMQGDTPAQELQEDIGGGDDINDPIYQNVNLGQNVNIGQNVDYQFLDVDQEDSSDPYSAIKSTDTERAVPEKILRWREEQVEMLEKKDAESETKKEEWREIAKKELDDWYKHTDEQLVKAKENNKQAETAFIQERDEMIPGHEWERVCRLCDFNPKNTRNTKDVSRMRSILLQLKQTPLVR